MQDSISSSVKSIVLDLHVLLSDGNSAVLTGYMCPSTCNSMSSCCFPVPDLAIAAWTSMYEERIAPLIAFVFYAVTTLKNIGMCGTVVGLSGWYKHA